MYVLTYIGFYLKSYNIYNLNKSTLLHGANRNAKEMIFFSLTIVNMEKVAAYYIMQHCSMLP